MEEAIGARIRNLREQQGLALDELARTAGMQQAELGAIENGRGCANVLELNRLSRALGCSVLELLHDGSQGWSWAFSVG